MANDVRIKSLTSRFSDFAKNIQYTAKKKRWSSGQAIMPATFIIRSLSQTESFLACSICSERVDITLDKILSEVV